MGIGDKKNKIAEIVCTFPPYRGGIGNVAKENSLILARRGYAVEVLTPWYWDFWERLRGKIIDPPEIEVKRMVSFFSYGNAGIVPQLWWRLGHFDFIHLHYPFFGGAEIVYFWYAVKKFYCRLMKKRCLLPRLIITYHMDVVGRGILGFIFRWHTKYLLTGILKQADKIIVSSFDYAKESDIKNFFFTQQDKFTEIPNGVDTRRFFPRSQDRELLAKHSLGEGDKKILFVGALDRAHYFKGIDYLLRTIKLIGNPTIKLLIVGAGNMKEEYIAKARALDIASQVIFTGFVSDEDLPRYYNLADLFVLPSTDKSEAFGVVLVEAMASGKPVIASNLPGVRSVVENGINGYLADLKNEGDLASCIKNIFASEDLSRQFGFAGRKKAEQKYDWKVIGDKLESLFKSFQ
ncbi:MAG: glycosyltransferase family 4 protein [Patescibacteria group bacterium]|nr:glycosyltransferase family 4 protein [Patescibacteria group bacterium]MDD5490730.1 glycosyltransferase family 4 protein [Patescibacteria group bacterium]